MQDLLYSAKAQVHDAPSCVLDFTRAHSGCPGLRIKTGQARSDISPPLVTHGSGTYRANNVPLYSGDLNGFLFRGLVWLAFESV